MKYAITGHKGLIGEFLKKRLDKEGHQCVLKVDQRESFNVLDLVFRESELKEDIDVFFHFAAQCRINESIVYPVLSHRNNSDGIFNVLEFCRIHNVKKIVVASTSRVLSPERNPYVASKVYVEEMVKAYHDCYGIEYIIIRPSTVYGPMFDDTSRAINNFLTNAFKGNNLQIYGTKDKTLDFTYIDDFVDAVILSTQNGWNKEYNVSGDHEERLVNVAEEIIEQVGSKSKIIFRNEERAQPQRVSVNISELRKIGYSPKVDIKEGIGKMVEWYKKNPAAWKKYIDK